MARELLIPCFDMTGCGGRRFVTIEVVSDLLGLGLGADGLVCDLDRNMVVMTAV